MARYERDAAATGQARLKLGKEIMAEHANNFHALAALYQPINPDGSMRDGGDWTKFEKFAVLAVEAASRVAPFESPRYAAIAVASAPPSSREAQLSSLSPRERLDQLLAEMGQRLAAAGTETTQ